MSVNRKPRTWSRRLARSTVLYVLVPYLAVTIIFAAFQRRLIYRPSIAVSLKVADLKLDPAEVTDVQLSTPDETQLNGWLMKTHQESPSSRNPLVICLPGNSLNRLERIQDLREVANCGYDVLIFDYRGFGDSSGRPSEAALSADARLIWNYATEELHYPAHTIILFGESLGGAVALSLWSDEITDPPKPRALILSSTFASMPRTVGWHYPWFPFRFLVLDRWPSIDRIARVTAPVTIFHGSADDFVPLSEARELAGAARPGATFIEIPGAGHNDIPMLQLRKVLTELRL